MRKVIIRKDNQLSGYNVKTREAGKLVHADKLLYVGEHLGKDWLTPKN